MDDLILVTVDCWRDEAVKSMPGLRTLLKGGGWERTSAIANSANTNNTFPSIFAASHYPEVWTREGKIRERVSTLPKLLERQGYATAGFVGSNPWLERWRDEFETFWNRGVNRSGRVRFSLRRSRNLLAMKPLIPAEGVLQRATS